MHFVRIQIIFFNSTYFKLEANLLPRHNDTENMNLILVSIELNDTSTKQKELQRPKSTFYQRMHLFQDPSYTLTVVARMLGANFCSQLILG